MEKKEYAKITKKYEQSSIRDRIEALFLDNIGKVVTNELIKQVARDPRTGIEPENWHQRISELRCDKGYTIQTNRDKKWLKVGEYLMPTSVRDVRAHSRIQISEDAWNKVLKRANGRCEWNEGGTKCGLEEGAIDPVGGGTVHLTPDHKAPHSSGAPIDPNDPDDWQALCGRHQVMKKNYWDDRSGKINTYGIIQAAPIEEKKIVYKFLRAYFGDDNQRKFDPIN